MFTEEEKLLQELAHAAPNRRQKIIDELVELVGRHLREVAKGQRERQRQEHINQTELLHEMYMRLDKVPLEVRRHFLAAAAVEMRKLVIDGARRASARREQGSFVLDPIDAVDLENIGPDPKALLDLDRAISKLNPEDQFLVNMRFFYGLTIEETAEVMNLSYPAVRRRWVTLKRKLMYDLQGQSEPEESQEAATQERDNEATGREAVINRVVEVIGDEEQAMRWLGSPVRALNYATPISRLHDPQGQAAVLRVLTQLEHGVL